MSDRDEYIDELLVFWEFLANQRVLEDGAATDREIRRQLDRLAKWVEEHSEDEGNE